MFSLQVQIIEGDALGNGGVVDGVRGSLEGRLAPNRAREAKVG